MLRVLRGMPMDGRGERLLLDSPSGGDSGHLHVVRTRARERQLRELERAAGRGLGARVVRLSDLVRRLAGRRTHLRAAIGVAERELLLDELAREEARPPLRGVPGLATWLGALFSRLKQGDVFSVDHAFERFRSLDRGDPGAAEALRLFGLYQTRLVELRLYDEDGLYLEVARDLGGPELPFERLQPSRKRLVVEGFYQTNVVERAVFDRLFAAFDETVWLLDLPEATGTRAFAAGVFDDLDAGGVTLEGDLSWLTARTAAAPTQLDLFADVEASGPDPEPSSDWFWDPAIGDRATLVLAEDERGEARFLAERAAALRREDPDASIAIAFPSDRQAAALMLEACADVGLPLELFAERTLAETAPAKILLGILALPELDFPRAGVVSALRGAGAGGVASGGVVLTAALVDRASRRAGITAGAREWLAKLDRDARKREHALTGAPEGERERLTREAREARDVHAGIAALVQALPAAGRACTTGAFVATARALLDWFGLAAIGAVGAGAPGPETIQALASTARARSGLAAALDAYEHAAVLLQHPERAWSDHAAAFAALVRGTTVPHAPVLRRGAVLLGIRELRGLATDHLLVGGLTEDAFPGPTEPAPLLGATDAARAGWRTPDARRREAEHLLVHALRSPRRTLVLSRSRQREGCEALPALALEIVRERFGLAEVAADAVLERAPALGRIAKARRAARALADPGTPSADAVELIEDLAASGPGAPLAWSRLRAERERFDRERVGRFEGMLEEAALPLLREEPGEIVMSTSRFDDYARCPAAYFFKRVLRLGRPDDVDRDVTPLDKGSVLHHILYRFHREVAAATSHTEKAAALEAIAREELLEVRADGLFAEVFAETLLRGLTTVEDDDRPGFLRRYLDFQEDRRSRFQPAAFEARFGRSRYAGPEGTLLSEEPLPLCEIETGSGPVRVLVTGSIDRIDAEDAGAEIRAFVIDYKTGELDDARNKTYRGMFSQLPLYAHVVPRLLEPHFGGKRVRTVGAAYFQIGRPKEFGLKEPVVDEQHAQSLGLNKRFKLLEDGRFEQLVAAWVGRAGDIAGSILGGKFHPTGATPKLPCDACDFRRACRGMGESVRLGRMRGAGLFPQVVRLIDTGKGAPAGEDESE